VLAAQAPGLRESIPFSGIYVAIMLIAVAVCALVAGLLLVIIVRYRRRRGGELPRQVFGNRRLEIAWTAGPALLVAVVFSFTLHNIVTARTPGSGLPQGRQPDVVAVGNQFWWEFRYPKAGVVTANELHLPVGRQMLVQLESDDVVHDFWVPQLGQKMDMVPGKTNYLWLDAPSPGTYHGACAEFCGAEHAWMRILAIAEPQAQFDAWLRQQQAPAARVASPLAARGEEVFFRHTCAACHAITGTTASGQVGPSLTQLGSRRTLAAGVLENNPENLARFLLDPQAVKPGIRMPDTQLSEPEARALAAYLESLK
jgi:cytochrome c oxidase subunit 2